LKFPEGVFCGSNLFLIKNPKGVRILEYWRKIFHPIITIILVFLASSFVFGQVRDNNLGQRLLAGIVFAFSLNMFQSLFESMAVVSFLNPLSAVLFPMLIVLLLTLFVWKIKSN
jgi:lipopolysaccharide export system permease protein